MKIFAGCKLNIKNPKHAPHKLNPKTAISYFPYFIAITERQAIIIIDILLARPSIPSVKLTALVVPSITNIIKGIYRIIGIFIITFIPGIKVSVPTPVLIRNNAYITDIASNP